MKPKTTQICRTLPTTTFGFCPNVCKYAEPRWSWLFTIPMDFSRQWCTDSTAPGPRESPKWYHHPRKQQFTLLNRFSTSKSMQISWQQMRLSTFSSDAETLSMAMDSSQEIPHSQNSRHVSTFSGHLNHKSLCPSIQWKQMVLHWQHQVKSQLRCLQL